MHGRVWAGSFLCQCAGGGEDKRPTEGQESTKLKITFWSKKALSYKERENK